MTNQESSKDNEFTIGDLVVLKSHPFHHISHFEQISIHGISDFVSPVMVILAMLRSADKVLKQHSSEELEGNYRYQYKCIWFSSKTMSFEEAWFKHRELKWLTKNIEHTIPELQAGDSIILKSSEIELRKKKISDEFRGQKKEAKVSSLHSFTCPVLTCIGFQTHSPKEPQISKSTGEQIRWEASKLVKAKYYNHLHNKFSEVLLPVEAVSLLPKITSKKIDDILHLISSESFCFFEYGDDTKFIKPVSLSTAGGFYFFQYINELTQVQEENIVTSNETLEKVEIDDILADSIFLFGEKNEKKREKVTKQLNEQKFCRIKYENRIGVNSTRFVKLLKLESPEGDERQYLVGFCYSRSDIRHFRLDRIYEIRPVKNEQLITKLKGMHQQSSNSEPGN